MNPIIGVMSAHDVKNHNYVTRENYLTFLSDAGGTPILLPLGSDVSSIDSLLDICDGILLTGGADVEPARYGEATLPCCGGIAHERDAFEIPFIRRAAERDIPMFGICRGIQVLNVALGGTLYQDVGTQIAPTASAHQQPEPYGEPTHSLTLVKDSPLNRLWKSESMMVNSMHHQAIKKPADGLQVDGRAEDGIIEAMSAKDGSRIFAVQFHPEYLSDHDAHAQRLFDHFVKLSREYQSEKEA